MSDFSRQHRHHAWKWQLISMFLLIIVIIQQYPQLLTPQTLLYSQLPAAASTPHSQISSTEIEVAPPIFTLAWLVTFLSQNPVLFLASIWGSGLIARILLTYAAISFIQRVWHASKFRRDVSLVHWAGTILAHRGYRSEAQQFNRLMEPPAMTMKRRLSRAGLTPDSNGSSNTVISGGGTTPRSSTSRRGSRDDGSINPLLMAAAANLAAVTVGSDSPRGLPPRPPSSSNATASGRRSGYSSPNTASGTSAPGSPALPQVEDTSNYNIPENSMLAFIYAHEHGAHGVEVDICLTKDLHIVVMHDNTLDRTMDMDGEVPLLTLDQIRQARYRPITTQQYVIRDTRNMKIDVTRVPTLEEVIQFCQARGLKLMIESKEYTNPRELHRQLSELFNRYKLYNMSFVATFNPFHLWMIRRKYPLIPTCLLYCRTCLQWYHEDGSQEMLLPALVNREPVRRILDWLLYYFSPTLIADYLGVSMIGPHNILVSPALVSNLATRGIVCDVWTVNSPLEKAWLKSLGTIVTSDRLFSRVEDINPFESIATTDIVPSAAAPYVREQEAAVHTAANAVMMTAGLDDSSTLVAAATALAQRQRAPSIHASEDFVVNAHYINASPAHIINSRPGTPSTNTSAAAAGLQMQADEDEAADAQTNGNVHHEQEQEQQAVPNNINHRDGVTAAGEHAITPAASPEPRVHDVADAGRTEAAAASAAATSSADTITSSSSPAVQQRRSAKKSMRVD